MMSKTHRRQTSHPVNPSGSGSTSGAGNGNSDSTVASVAAEMIVSSMLEKQGVTQNRIKTAGHRRSHSYGHHKGFHEPSSNQHR